MYAFKPHPFNKAEQKPTIKLIHPYAGKPFWGLFPALSFPLCLFFISRISSASSSSGTPSPHSARPRLPGLRARWQCHFPASVHTPMNVDTAVWTDPEPSRIQKTLNMKSRVALGYPRPWNKSLGGFSFIRRLYFLPMINVNIRKKKKLNLTWAELLW